MRIWIVASLPYFFEIYLNQHGIPSLKHFRTDLKILKIVNYMNTFKNAKYDTVQ